MSEDKNKEQEIAAKTAAMKEKLQRILGEFKTLYGGELPY